MAEYDVVATFRRDEALDDGAAADLERRLRTLDARLQRTAADARELKVGMRVTATWPTAAVSRVVELLRAAAADHDLDLGDYRGVEVRQR